ncbi:MAG: hypothetical protein CMQ41_07935 [Gammaproteobacteria bacterium]|nr:hypothetical protein [Gammaproteobacteria bacterium]|tara:strand:- start:26 stop:223 length:198 start_codon:yes stop_codon:yes gene_type:complete
MKSDIFGLLEEINTLEKREEEGHNFLDSIGIPRQDNKGKKLEASERLLKYQDEIRKKIKELEDKV